MKGFALAALVLLPGLVTGAETDRQALIAPCLECHDSGEGAPARQVLLGSHGIEGEGLEDRRGCLDCHGDSAGHIAAPETQAPDVSFGPRWTANPAAQDAPCLGCHEDNTARNWRHALHMVNNITCITCHDIHTEQDRVLTAEDQFAICTTCHKAQKSGVHDLGRGGEGDPACSLCHNPHNHEAAGPQMHANNSAGCMFCHDSEQMDSHQEFEEGKRDCLDCHQGISHAPEDSAPPLHPRAVAGRGVTLFYPGHASREWLVRDHPGSQPLRQGTDCQRCHRGDEADIGAAMAPGLEPSSRVVGIAFSSTGEKLNIKLNWSGDRDDRQIALMWGGPGNEEFVRGGCFAACHDAEPGQAARLIAHRGTDPLDARMGGLTGPGQAVERWRIQLDSGEVETAVVRSGVENQETNSITASVRHESGQWTVELAVGLDGVDSGFQFSRAQRYTFGMALHSDRDSGREHLVSLPMSLGFGTGDTEFSAP